MMDDYRLTSAEIDSLRRFHRTFYAKSLPFCRRRMPFCAKSLPFYGRRMPFCAKSLPFYGRR
ncbi:MAG: hypothetical protein LBT46_03790, partial [Planctomycetaceae bacterium]|nr:hypothetical protein [Planctomycetaceae bacterium]